MGGGGVGVPVGEWEGKVRCRCGWRMRGGNGNERDGRDMVDVEGRREPNERNRELREAQGGDRCMLQVMQRQDSITPGA